MRLIEFRSKINEGIAKPIIYKVTDNKIIEILLDVEGNYIKPNTEFISKSYHIELSRIFPNDILISVNDSEGTPYLSFTLDTNKKTFHHNRSGSRTIPYKKEKELGDLLIKKYEISGFWS
jgi:hypothetical protein